MSVRVEIRVTVWDGLDRTNHRAVLRADVPAVPATGDDVELIPGWAPAPVQSVVWAPTEGPDGIDVYVGLHRYELHHGEDCAALLVDMASQGWRINE